MKKLLSNSENNEHLKYFMSREVQNHKLIFPFAIDIIMQILHTILKTFSKVLTRRICLTIKSLFSWWSLPLFSWP